MTRIVLSGTGLPKASRPRPGSWPDLSGRTGPSGEVAGGAGGAVAPPAGLKKGAPN